ncbi:hypothetical protein [Enterococcus faecalis]|uniref:hypothetical protein n=1 Tax=Enterococcus TaxID=1350 RepID=UPI000710F69B|nr:hypothetical protein [Enterococcus faecalis]KXF69855.1 hypothetical protein AQ486_12550 [Enterococcus faecalis]KXF73929.1 hypothetical protein AQ487_04020 [Enterococcus faecalis]MBC2813590.1 hypothetical protein [Enterococcus faecalis]MBC2817934.1 hypothetical protein [Enterococcus faecalis]MBC2820539.1 hypothetical protein [Enterococcus faecalis]
MKKCFFVTPIGEENSDIRKQSDELLEQIQYCFLHNTIEFEIMRADLDPHNQQNIERIHSCIKNADLLIVDLSGNNPNVYYELGYARALCKEVIQIRDKTTSNLPFDVSGYNTPTYDLSNNETKEKFRNLLSETIKNIQFDKSVTHIGGGFTIEKVGSIDD